MAADDSGESKTSKRINLIFIGIAVLVLFVLAGGAYWYFFLNQDEKPVAETEQVVVDGPLQYYDLQPDFVVSFLTQTNQRFVQLGLSVVTKRQPVIDALKLHEPVVRNDILAIVGKYGFTKLRTIDGKLELQQELKEHLNTVLQREANVDGIIDVIFTDFVTQ